MNMSKKDALERLDTLAKELFSETATYDEVMRWFAKAGRFLTPLGLPEDIRTLLERPVEKEYVHPGLESIRNGPDDPALEKSERVIDRMKHKRAGVQYALGFVRDWIDEQEELTSVISSASEQDAFGFAGKLRVSPDGSAWIKEQPEKLDGRYGKTLYALLKNAGTVTTYLVLAQAHWGKNARDPSKSNRENFRKYVSTVRTWLERHSLGKFEIRSLRSQGWIFTER